VTATNPLRSAARVMAVVAAVVLGVVGYQVWGPTSPASVGAPVHLSNPAGAALPAPTPGAGADGLPGPLPPRSDASAVLGLDGGAVPDGATVFDDVPAVANLDEALLTALRRAGSEASGDGVVLQVNSGWRSRAYQAQLLRDAVAKYGSEDEAARWVSTPDTSEHVKGKAVDLGSAGATWLSRHGDAYGLCRIYDNEPWHFELRRDAADDGCPRRYADAAHDPRMQS
jgi:D-alanyl-D-alanine carboxypeptidase